MSKNGAGRNPLNWQKSNSDKKLSQQSLYERLEEKQNRDVEKFLKKYEKRTGKVIERDWND